MVARLRLDLQYDGGAFHGWAAQPGLRTVEGVLREAIATAVRLPQDALALVVAGRTDAGVHATGQVCHLDVPDGALPATLEDLRSRLGGLMPEDARVTAVSLAPPGFDARFSATGRRYHYLVGDRPWGLPPLSRHQAVHHPRPLDVDLMNEASAALVGLNDFAAFCRRRDSPAGTVSTVRTLLAFTWQRGSGTSGPVRAALHADAFCHSMVRALVGCLLAVGDGRRPVTWPAQVLAARVRDPGVAVAPARGLTLVGVDYPPDGDLAERARQARAVRTLPAAPAGQG